MRINRVAFNNRKKLFEVSTRKGIFTFPYAKLEAQPTPSNQVVEVFADPELGYEGFTYRLESGKEGSVHQDHVLEYNQDPNYLTDLLLYKLTLKAKDRLAKRRLSIRELARRLETSPTQLYRLLEPTNYRKSVRQMLSLLYLLDCEVDLVVCEKQVV